MYIWSALPQAVPKEYELSKNLLMLLHAVYSINFEETSTIITSIIDTSSYASMD